MGQGPAPALHALHADPSTAIASGTNKFSLLASSPAPLGQAAALMAYQRSNPSTCKTFASSNSCRARECFYISYTGLFCSEENLEASARVKTGAALLEFEDSLEQ